MTLFSMGTLDHRFNLCVVNSNYMRHVLNSNSLISDFRLLIDNCIDKRIAKTNCEFKIAEKEPHSLPLPLPATTLVSLFCLVVVVECTKMKCLCTDTEIFQFNSNNYKQVHKLNVKCLLYEHNVSFKCKCNFNSFNSIQ